MDSLFTNAQVRPDVNGQPELVLDAPALPPDHEYLYTRAEWKGGEVLFAEHPSGLVRFVLWYPNEPAGGAITGNFELASGEVVKVRGGWSSRPGVMNALGYPPSLDCIVRVPWSGSYLRFAAHVTVRQARELLARYAPDWTLRLDNSRRTEPTYQLVPC